MNEISIILMEVTRPSVNVTSTSLKNTSHHMTLIFIWTNKACTEHAARCCKEVGIQPSHLPSNQSVSQSCLLSILVTSFKYEWIWIKFLRVSLSFRAALPLWHCIWRTFYACALLSNLNSLWLDFSNKSRSLLPLRWHYNPMQTFASFMDVSQSPLFLDLSFQFVILHLLISVCTQFNHLFFGGPISCLSWGLLLKTLLTFLLLSI